MQGIQIKKFGGEDFGSTLEELKQIAPLAVTMDGVKFEGPARKVSAILALAGVGVELIAEIERLTADAERFAIIRALMCDTAFQEALAPLICDIAEVDDPSVEQLEAQFDLHIKIATDAGLWPIKLDIDPVPVVRDEMGLWTHPQWPSTDDELIPYQWFTDRGLEISEKNFEYDAPESLQEAWFGNGIADCTSWEPSKPSGDGWFIFSIHDTEDGPLCVWVRKVQP